MAESLYYFNYLIKYYCEIKDKVMCAGGIVAGSSIREATDRVLNYYGENETIKITIDCITEHKEVLPLEECDIDSAQSDKEKILN